MYIKLFESFLFLHSTLSSADTYVLLQDLALPEGGGAPLLEPKLQTSFTWTSFYTVKHDTKQPQHQTMQ